MACDETLWRGVVFVCTDEEEKMTQVIDECLSSGTEHLCFKAYGVNPNDQPTIDLKTIAERCPNLRYLEFLGYRIPPWTAFNKPWSSLKTLSLVFTKMNWNTFESAQLHLDLPNIERLDLYKPILTSEPSESHDALLIPDLSVCARLDKLYLEDMFFMMPRMPSNKNPFPSQVRRLVVHEGIFYKFGERKMVRKNEFVKGLRSYQLVGWEPWET